MTKDNPQAAGQGGHEPFSAARTPPPEGRPPGFVFPGFAARDNALESDDDFRRFAASRLADQLDLGVSLIAISEHLASLPGEDRVRPLYAAARLMNSNANLGRALAHAALEQPIEVCRVALEGTGAVRGGLRFNEGIAGRGRGCFSADHFTRLERLMANYSPLVNFHSELL